MKGFVLFLCLMSLFGVNSFAGSILDEYNKNNDIYKQPDYKASPKIDYHNSTPAKQSAGIGSGQNGMNQGVGANGNPNGQNGILSDPGKDKRIP